MSTVRAFSNNQRISTGRPMKNGSFFQAYPTRTVFASQDEWMNHWKKTASLSFVEEGYEDMPPLIPVSSVSKQTVPSTPPPATAPTSPPRLSRKGSSKAKMSDWNYTKTKTFVAPAGTYYIGDICYFLNDNLYDAIFGGHGYASGLYTQKSGNDFFMVDGTAYGDGEYVGSDGFGYGVDAGIIGIVTMPLGEGNTGNGGKIHTFREPVEIKFGNGLFRFKSNSKYLAIDTVGDTYNSDTDW
jgi:hypothetical protein